MTNEEFIARAIREHKMDRNAELVIHLAIIGIGLGLFAYAYARAYYENKIIISGLKSDLENETQRCNSLLGENIFKNRQIEDLKRNIEILNSIRIENKKR
jgi:hypothetical protein